MIGDSYDQKGQALALALIVVAITALISVPVLALTSSVLHRSSASRAALEEQYSVDAGTEDAIWRIAHDSGFRGDWTPYSITVNGDEQTSIEVEPRSLLPATPVPTPTQTSGNDVLLWTTVDASEIDLLGPSGNVIRLTIHIRDDPLGSKPRIVRLVEVLPKGFSFAGNLECDGSSVQCSNLVWSAGQKKGDPITIGDLLEPSVFSVEEIPCAVECDEVLSGGNPWDPAFQPNSCPILNRSDAGGDYQRLDWNWPEKDQPPNNEKPQIPDGTEVTISFDVNVPQSIDLAGLPLSDNPWLFSQPNLCNAGGSEQLQAGRPLELSGYLTTLITARQGHTALDSLVQFDLPGPASIDILSQRYGRGEEP